MVHMLYHGEVSIDYWEYLLGILLFAVIFIFGVRHKQLLQREAPEYRFFISGLAAKLVGGLAFSLIYFYYYGGGDTMSYFYSAVSMSKLAVKDPVGYFTVLFGDNTVDKRDLFDYDTGWPYSYVFYDPRTFFVIRFTSVLALVTLNSYLLSTILLATWSYVGIWRCFRTFVSYYPALQKSLAVGFLFMPSVIFWGSGIMKDTITLSMACAWVHCFDEVVFKKRERMRKGLGLVFAGAILVLVKPYIFMVVMPCTLLWWVLLRVQRLPNAVLRAAFLPTAMVVMLLIAGGLLLVLGDRLDKFAPEAALNTVMVTQSDMVRSEQYGTGYFNVGPMDGTWGSVLSKFPIALNAALFRPYLWEAKSIVMAIGAFENLFLLGLLLWTIIKVGLLFPIQVFRNVPIAQFCILFTVVFGFVIGISTPNFGALVRFKIPLVPFFVAALHIVKYHGEVRRWSKLNGRRFSFADRLPLPSRAGRRTRRTMTQAGHEQ